MRWSAQDFDTFAGKQLVEHGGALGVPVANQEPELPGPLPSPMITVDFVDVLGLLRQLTS